MFYSFFKKRVKPTEVIKYSRKPFENHLIRALNKGIKELTRSY